MAHSVQGLNFSYHPENRDPSSNTRKRGLDAAFSVFEQMAQEESTPSKKRHFEGVEDKAQPTNDYVQTFFSPVAFRSLALQHQLNEFATCLSTIHLSYFENLSIQQRIQAIESNPYLNEEIKLAELGVLYDSLVRGIIYLNQNSTDSLVEQRILELKQMLLHIKAQHVASWPETLAKKIPSGCLLYLQNCFAEMIFPRNGSFNLGGCYAVKVFLHSHLNAFVTEEWRNQALKIVDRLISDVSFRSKFFISIFLCHEFHDYIREDLQLPFEEMLSAWHVRKSLFISFLSLIAQIRPETNCYAVASVEIFFKEHPDAVLDLLLDVMQKGNFTFQGHEIPLGELLKFHFFYDKVHWSPVEGPLKLRLFQNVIVGLFVFIAINGDSVPFVDTVFKSYRVKIIDLWIDYIAESLRVGSPIFYESPNGKQFMTGIKAEIEKRFWLIEHKDRPNIHNNRVVYAHYSKSFPFRGNSSDSSPPFECIRRAIFLKNGTFTPADSLTDISSHLGEILEQCAPHSSMPYLLLSILKERLHSVEFKTCQVKCLNETPFFKAWAPLEEQDFLESDLFFLRRLGGHVAPIISSRVTLNWPQAVLHKIDEKDPLTFFVKLCTLFKTKNSERIGLQAQRLALTSIHVFTLDPNLFSDFFNQPEERVYANLVLPGRVRLDQVCDRELLESCLLSFKEPHEIQSILAALPAIPLTYAQVRIEVLQHLTKEEHSDFDQAFDTYLRMIPVETQDYLKILNCIGIFLDHNNLQIFRNFLLKKFESDDICLPRALAKEIKKILYLMGFSFISEYCLEKILCVENQIPQIIELGNLIFANEMREKLKYESLVLKYDLALEQLRLGVREDSKDTSWDLEEQAPFHQGLIIATEDK